MIAAWTTLFIFTVLTIKCAITSKTKFEKELLTNKILKKINLNLLSREWHTFVRPHVAGKFFTRTVSGIRFLGSVVVQLGTKLFFSRELAVSNTVAQGHTRDAVRSWWASEIVSRASCELSRFAQ